MAEIRFYHLMTGTPAQALLRLLTKALSQGRRAVIRVCDDPAAERLSEELWTATPDSFLPHGTAKDADPALQPVWITARDENPNGADILILGGGMPASDLPEGFSMICTIFDGRNDSELGAARAQWKTYRDTYGPDNADFLMTYWQQTSEGEWVKKA